jgi:hypothetical protein
MKNYTLLKGILVYILISLIGITNAQTLTIKGKLLLNDESTLESFKVSVIDLDSTTNFKTITTKAIKSFNCNF